MIEPVNKTEIPAQLSQENKSSYQANKNSYQATQAGPGMVGFQEWDGKNLEKIKRVKYTSGHGVFNSNKKKVASLNSPSQQFFAQLSWI